MTNEEKAPRPEGIKRPKILLAIIVYQTLSLLAMVILLGHAAITEEGFIDESGIKYIVGIIILIPLMGWQIIAMWKLHINAFYIAIGLIAFSTIYFFIDETSDLFGILIHLALFIYLFYLRNARILLSTKEKEHLLSEGE